MQMVFEQLQIVFGKLQMVFEMLQRVFEKFQVVFEIRCERQTMLSIRQYGKKVASSTLYVMMICVLN